MSENVQNNFASWITNAESYFNNIKYEAWNCELASTLTDSLNLSRISAFILNVLLIEILVCVSWKPNVVLLKRNKNGIPFLLFMTNNKQHFISVDLFIQLRSFRSKCLLCLAQNLTFFSVKYHSLLINFRI